MPILIRMQSVTPAMPNLRMMLYPASICRIKEEKMKKLFISCPMRKRSDEDIRKTFDKLHRIAEAVFDKELEVIPTYFEGDPPANVNEALWYLGESVKKLSEADYFIGIFDEAREFRGCIIENIAAKNYNIPFYLVNLGNAAPDVIERRRQNVLEF